MKTLIMALALIASVCLASCGKQQQNSFPAPGTEQERPARLQRRAPTEDEDRRIIIKGKIESSPVPGAVISLSSGTNVKYGVTDSNGAFSCRAAANVDWKLIVTHPLYKPLVKQISLQDAVEKIFYLESTEVDQ